MPELPEVQALASFLDARAGLRLARVDLAAISALKTFDPPVSALEGRRLRGASRRGKFLVLDLSEGGAEGGAEGGPQGSPDDDPLYLVIHLARAGWLSWKDDLPAAPPRPGRGPLAFRAAFVGDGGEAVGGFDVTEAGTRKGLAIHVVRDPLDVPGIARLGPDPLDDAFTSDVLEAVLTDAGGKQLKGVLRDQGTIAGIGNAYSDEILHVARLSPFRPASRLDDEERARLLDAIRSTLLDAVDRSVGQGTGSLKSEKKAGMRVHGRTGQPCPVCGDVVREVSYADSSLQYCATCQTGGQVLADRRMSRLLR